MSTNPPIDYESYARTMRIALSGEQICLLDGQINHQYFHTKKGLYWSDKDQLKLISGLRKYDLSFQKISKEIFKGEKTQIEVQLRICLLFGVKNIKQITMKEIEEFFVTLDNMDNGPVNGLKQPKV